MSTQPLVASLLSTSMLVVIYIVIGIAAGIASGVAHIRSLPRGYDVDEFDYLLAALSAVLSIVIWPLLAMIFVLMWAIKKLTRR